MKGCMMKILIGTVLSVLIFSSSYVVAEGCPEGYRWDAYNETCVQDDRSIGGVRG